MTQRDKNGLLASGLVCIFVPILSAAFASGGLKSALIMLGVISVVVGYVMVLYASNDT